MYTYIGDSFSHFPNQYRYIYIWESGKVGKTLIEQGLTLSQLNGKVGKWESGKVLAYQLPTQSVCMTLYEAVNSI